MKRLLVINDGHDVEVIPSSSIAQALRRKEQAVPCLVWPEPTVTVGAVPEPRPVGVRGRGGQIVGTVLIGGVALYILIHLVIWFAKG